MYPFIELNSAPLERFNDKLFGTGNETGLIGIFYAKDKITSMFFSKEIIEEGCPNSTGMKRAGWARCETYTNFFIHGVKFVKMDGKLKECALKRR
jgi:hypothetical protein